MKKTILSNKRGITLIALIITIIVMLILVILVIRLATSGGLFGYAGKATKDTKDAMENEKNLGGEFEVDGKRYASIQDYLNGVAMPNDTLSVITKEQASGARPAVIYAVARKMSKAELKALSEEEKKAYFTDAMSVVQDTGYESFDDIYFGETEINSSDVTTIEQAYDLLASAGNIDSSQYSNAYNFIINVAPNSPTQSELEGMTDSQKINLFLSALAEYWNWPEITWDDIYFRELNKPNTVDEAFEILKEQGWNGYNDVYDFILYYGVDSINATFVYGDETKTGYEVYFLMTKPAPQTIVATYMNENDEIETGRTTVTPTTCRIEEFSQIQTTRQTLTIDGYTVTVPAGFAYGTSENVGHVTTGLVITDSVEQIGGRNLSNGNEFVWIPVPGKNMKVATTSDQYAYSSSYAEPKELTSTDGWTNSQTGGPFKIDSQAELDYYYGSGYFTYPTNVSDETNVTDFSYGVHYKEMAQSINQFGGFYIGRYETTIDSNNNIGSKVDTPVLRSEAVIKEGTNPKTDTPYYYRWWGLYYAGRHASVYGNGSSVQTNMIWGQQFDKMYSFFNDNSISYGTINTQEYSNTPSSICNAGQVVYTRKYYTTSMINDIIFNIYDLRGNVFDGTAEANSTNARVGRGGQYINRLNVYASNRTGGLTPYTSNLILGMRLTLYIK